MRRWTLITLVVLTVTLALVAFFQIRAAQRPERYPGPGVSPTAP
ncbi:MAG TPA: hypothetical protein VG709_02405 [Actinomycetota bacterium]|nr:hypothetical protein [Actinomycetota bacterium]